MEEFVRYFFPNHLQLIDFQKSFDFLDKELQEILPDSASKHRHADKLFRAWLIDGKEQWFLVHVEVQGYADAAFAKRMFQYAYRIKDRYELPLAAVAIYTDTNRKYHFTSYHESFFDTELIYKFKTFVLVDYLPKELHQKDNIFGLVLEAARLDIDYRKRNDNQRLNIKKSWFGTYSGIRSPKPKFKNYSILSSTTPILIKLIFSVNLIRTFR